MRRPNLTVRVLRGLVAATSAVLAGPIDADGGFTRHQAKEITDADQWIRRMREWKLEQRKLARPRKRTERVA